MSSIQIPQFRHVFCLMAIWPRYLSHRVFIQHSVNLFNVGIQASIAAACIALRSRFVLVACLPPFMFDIGYWIAMDIPGIGGAMGEVQTYIVSTSVILAALDLKDACEAGLKCMLHKKKHKC